MHRVLGTITALALLLSIVASPAHARRTEEALDTMNETLASLNQRWQKHQSEMEAKMNDIEEIVRNVRRNQAELMLKINELATTISVAEGKTAENVNTLEEITQQMSTLNNRIDLLTRFVAGDDYVEESKAMAESPSVVFEQSREDYLKQRYDMAIDGFSMFISEYPDDPRVAEAQYWIAECHYSQGAFKDAIVEFRKVVMNHKDADQAQDALLKIGLAQYNLKNYEDAKAVFEDVIATYPNSRQAKLAEERLKIVEQRMQ